MTLAALDVPELWLKVLPRAEVRLQPVAFDVDSETVAEPLETIVPLDTVSDTVTPGRTLTTLTDSGPMPQPLKARPEYAVPRVTPTVVDPLAGSDRPMSSIETSADGSDASHERVNPAPLQMVALEVVNVSVDRGQTLPPMTFTTRRRPVNGGLGTTSGAKFTASMGWSSMPFGALPR